MTDIANISSYKFVSIPEDELPSMRKNILMRALELDLKGTILLSCEGINHFLAGLETNIKKMKAYLEDTYPCFEGLAYKYSYTDRKPFNRMLVKIKNEIIPMGVEEINPEQETAPYIKPEQLKKWYDTQKDMIILDTRNDYEIRLGTFKNATHLNIQNFREFNDALDILGEDAKEKPIVTFCTGGIRCEKAAPLMLKKGFKNVYQLDGGILKYFEDVGEQHYDGDCFVFDLRVAVDPKLNETATIQCYSCQEPLTKEQQHTAMEQGGCCPYCKDMNIAEQVQNAQA